MADKNDDNLPASARKLLDIVTDYRKRTRDPTASLSELSLHLLTDRGDRQVLARWTNPGGRSNWYIPLRRVREVAQLLGASEYDADVLMVARLQELDDAGDQSGAVDAVSWALELAKRSVSAEQQFILKVVEDARGGWAPEVSLAYISDKARKELTERLRGLLREVGDELTSQLQDEECTDEQLASMRAERKAFLEASRKRWREKQKSRPMLKLRGEAPAGSRVVRAAAMRQARKLIRDAQRNARLAADKD